MAPIWSHCYNTHFSFHHECMISFPVVDGDPVQHEHEERVEGEEQPVVQVGLVGALDARGGLVRGVHAPAARALAARAEQARVGAAVGRVQRHPAAVEAWKKDGAARGSRTAGS